jgi:hypothetical protein
MGVEFIAKTKDSLQKAWARGCEELKVADLFTIHPDERRTIVVRPETPNSFRAGETYIVHADGDDIRVYAGHHLVGVSVNPPSSVLNRIRALGGKTIGMLQNTREHSGLVDVAVHWGVNNLP